MRCGHVAVIGKPNVGKSTLINTFLRRKLNITSPRRNTTHHCVRGIYTDADLQIVFVDTPGLARRPKTLLERHIAHSAVEMIDSVDAVLMLSEGTHWNRDDEFVIQAHSEGVPWVLAINKTDRLSDKAELLPHLARLGELGLFADMVPICARRSQGIDVLTGVLARHLPEGPELFDADTMTDRSERFLAVQILREQLLRQLGEELPYVCGVHLGQYRRGDEDESGEQTQARRIDADIWVERASQKAIIIGRGGAKLKAIGSAAREQMQRAFGAAVVLKVWVRVQPGWSDDAGKLRQLGYGE
ncbi:MAG: GTPase Era [Gammaproteobacteria bacterium AqS3]|nr:GTPase Era [Gammaproteobacteria bacterium AqS3]